MDSAGNSDENNWPTVLVLTAWAFIAIGVLTVVVTRNLGFYLLLLPLAGALSVIAEIAIGYHLIRYGTKSVSAPVLAAALGLLIVLWFAVQLARMPLDL